MEIRQPDHFAHRRVKQQDGEHERCQKTQKITDARFIVFRFRLLILDELCVVTVVLDRFADHCGRDFVIRIERHGLGCNIDINIGNTVHFFDGPFDGCRAGRAVHTQYKKS